MTENTDTIIISSEVQILPKIVKDIGPFHVQLRGIDVEENNPQYCSINGVLFSKDMKTLIKYPEQHDGKEYSVPSGVETIDDFAFYNCVRLSSVVLPYDVKRIGRGAFCNSNLKQIELPAKPIPIDELAFATNEYVGFTGYKRGLGNVLLRFRHNDVLIPVLLTNNWRVNKNEVLLAEFVEAVDIGRKQELFLDMKDIGYKRFMAFYLYLVHDDIQCKQYLIKTKNTLKKSMYASLVKYLSTDASKKSVSTSGKKLSKDASLSKWSFKTMNDGTYGVMRYKGKETAVIIPESYNGTPVTAICPQAFSGEKASNCREIKKIAMPKSIVCIEDEAFSYCECLEEIVFSPALESIGQKAFIKCKKLRISDVPDSVSDIGSDAFAFCNSITEFSFPPNILTIPERAFEYCENLETIHLNESITSIGKQAFNNCKKLKNVSIPDSLKKVGRDAFTYCPCRFELWGKHREVMSTSNQ